MKNPDETHPGAPLLVILGPTASGKTRLAVQVADQLGGEILSADSRQIYKGMDIGTGKDLAEYDLANKKIPYHLIDIREAGEQYNVNEFQKDFENAFREINSRGHVPILCGGTGFYIYALLAGQAYASIPVNELLRSGLENASYEDLQKRFESLHSVYHEVADRSTRKRLIRAIEIAVYLNEHPEMSVNAKNTSGYTAVIVGLNPEVGLRREKITRRLNERLQGGLVQEVQLLLENGISAEQLTWYGLEYKMVTAYLTGEMDFEQMKTKLETEIHRFAKRQMTFFRKMERDGFTIHWLDDSLTEHEKVSEIVRMWQNVQNVRVKQ